MRIAERGGELLARVKQVFEHLDVLGIGALVVGKEHARAQVGVGGESRGPA